MAEQTKPDATTAAGDTDPHAEALRRYERGYERERENITRAYEDLAFRAGEGQWDEVARRGREDEGRPCLMVDKSSQFCRQVTGDMRQMRPAIKVTPVDDRGSAEVAATILPGLIRYIEQRSDAQAAYYGAVDSQVAAGIGHWRITTEYAGTDTFLQEIGVSPIEDGVSVIWDPDAALPTREDAAWCFVPADLSRAAFEARWPDASADALDRAEASVVLTDWVDTDRIRVAEYWEKVPAKRRLALMPDGGVDDVTDDAAAEADAVALGARIETRDDHKVMRSLISASEILEGPDEWPGRHIPIVPLIGEEIRIGGRTVRRGVIRTLRDPQRLYNYSISAQAEVIALQPKAPFTGTRKNFEKFVDQWETANAKNWPYLEYEPDPANGGQAPQRVQPAVSSQGIGELLATATGDMSAVTGIYPASLGAASNETSGRAIMARQREGDTGTYVYVDNFARALRHTGRILLDLIPHIYDTARTIRIVGDDGKVALVKINETRIDPNGDGIATHVLNDVTIGAYDLSIEMGPSFATARAEARDGMQALMQALGPQAVILADLFASQQDFPLADKIAKRLRTMLPPPIQQAEATESGEQPPPPPPPDPTQQAAVQAEQQKAQIEQMKMQLEAAKLDVERERIAAELEKARIEAASAAAQQAPAGGATDPRVDQLAAAVDAISAVVVQLVDAVQAMQPAGEPPPMPGDAVQGGVPPPMDAANPVFEPPPGGFFAPAEPPQGAPPA
jgi:hypothetical protein